MIEINTQIEDLFFDPISKKYRVVGTNSTRQRNFSHSGTSKKNQNHDSVTFKIQPQKVRTMGNLIERKGLHVDFIVK